MNKNRITLSEAEKFHGHLGPYLVLGILAGELALKKFKADKYFGLEVKVYGANRKPRSCLIDGLQLSTGATYGKGNINKFNGPLIKIELKSDSGLKKLTIEFKDTLIKKLAKANTHRDAELLARKLYKTDYSDLFKLTTKN